MAKKTYGRALVSGMFGGVPFGAQVTSTPSAPVAQTQAVPQVAVSADEVIAPKWVAVLNGDGSLATMMGSIAIVTNAESVNGDTYQPNIGAQTLPPQKINDTQRFMDCKMFFDELEKKLPANAEMHVHRFSHGGRRQKLDDGTWVDHFQNPLDMDKLELTIDHKVYVDLWIAAVASVNMPKEIQGVYGNVVCSVRQMVGTQLTVKCWVGTNLYEGMDKAAEFLA